MKKKVIISSIFATAILVSISFVSVVGYQPLQATKKGSFSPLFIVRTQRATQKISDGITSSFLGKGKQINVFPERAKNEELIKAAIKIFCTNPAVLSKLLENLDRFPSLTGLLTKYSVTKLEIKNYLRILKSNPSLITDGIVDRYIFQPYNDKSKPLGLSTSNALGCFIVAVFALIPLTVVLTLLLLLFTLRILTCMNVNDCANAIAEQIWNQLMQGLNPG